MDDTNKKIDSQECDEVFEKLGFLVESSLSEDDEKIVKEHLLSCKNCSDLVDELIEVKKSLNSIENLEFPVELNYRISKALLDITPVKKKPKFAYKRFATVAAVFVLGFISVQMYNMTSNPLDQGGQMLSKSAPEMSASSSGLNDQNVAMMASPNSLGATDGQYEKLIAGKLEGYNYEIQSKDLEKKEFTLNIISDKDGKAINREFIIQYSDNKISSKDNWLDIKF
ncbi:MAG: hypothetical protein WCF96_00850 [Eubacteriales bacterium]